jgi:hypothetical protein
MAISEADEYLEIEVTNLDANHIADDIERKVL